MSQHTDGRREDYLPVGHTSYELPPGDPHYLLEAPRASTRQAVQRIGIDLSAGGSPRL